LSTRATLCLFLLISLSLAGCGEQPRVIQRPGEAKITITGGNDPNIEAATKEARKTLPQFVKALQHPTPSQSRFQVKALFHDTFTAEDMWLQHLKYDGTQFTGELVNNPYQIQGYQKGNTVSVAAKEIVDWAYRDGDKIQGAYTESALNAEDKAAATAKPG